MTSDRKRILFKTFFESQFKCCPLSNNRINKLHERALRLIYNDYETSFSNSLTVDGPFTVLHTNIQTLLLKIYKTKHNLSESCLKNLFGVVNGNYDLHSPTDFGVPGINTAFYGANSIRYFGSMIWNSLLNDLRNVCDFDLFKTTIWRWKPVDYPCRLCKNYLGSLGFINVSLLYKFSLLCFVKIKLFKVVFIEKFYVKYSGIQLVKVY